MPATRLSRRAALAGLAAGGAALASPALAVPETGKKLNFLYIMADDMGYADVSCYGRRDYATPAIDALAQQGVRFTQAYANSAVCTASTREMLKKWSAFVVASRRMVSPTIYFARRPIYTFLPSTV